MILTGHQENAEFALAMCPTEPLVLSGGTDKLVVFWSIQDHLSTLGEASSTKSPAAPSGSSSAKQTTKVRNEMSINGPRVGPRGVFQGHRDTVEDVQFCPSSTQEFCSVGDDSCLILWDARTGTGPAVKVMKAHKADIHCVDWNPHDVNLILTGSADNSVCLFDRRNLTSGSVGSPLHKFKGHKAPVLCVQWSPDKASVFASAAEDSLLNVWDHEKVGKTKERADPKMPDSPPAGLFFQHAGHRGKVVDLHWDSCNPWTVASVSHDCASIGGGGTLQVWRIMDWIYRPEEEVLSEFKAYKAHVADCGPKFRSG